jgi:hypothetical protein
MTSDDLNRLEAALREKAAEIPYAQTVPPALLARSRRRIARNTTLSLVAVIAVISIASTGIAALRRPEAVGPASRSPGTAVAGCAAADLRVTPVLDGAAGSIEGSIDLRNAGDQTCTLQGRPSVALVDSDGTLAIDPTDVPPQWQVDGASAPAGWPVVSLAPGDSAAIRVRWSNQCPQVQGSVTWQVGLGAGGTSASSGSDRVPPCLGSAEGPLLEVGPFEPASRS